MSIPGRPLSRLALTLLVALAACGTAPDLASARLFGEVKARLATAGQPVADADLFIAAITLSRGATLVTGNRRHYERIPGLVVEDWLRPHGGHPGR